MRGLQLACAFTVVSGSFAYDLQAQIGTSVLVASVADAETRRPVVNAEVSLPELRLTTRTDVLGEARIPAVPRGDHRVLVRLPGYAAADVTLRFDADTVGPVFFLEATRAVLDTVVTKATAISPLRRDFERRRVMAIGHFLSDSQLRREGDRSFLLVAESKLPGVRLMPGADGRYRLASTRGSCGYSRALGETDSSKTNGRGGGMRGGPTGKAGSQMLGSCASGAPCWVQIYLDGVKVGADFDLIRTQDLYGVESYSGANVPAQYRTGGSACGVLLLWSRPPAK